MIKINHEIIKYIDQLAFKIRVNLRISNFVNRIKRMAERMGFEPMKEFPLYTLSKRAPSTTRPSLL